MATWPSGTKASTANLDAGTDSPSSARADLKQNTDNVNNIIDMFNISTPSNNQILKYNSANSRFELGTDLNTDAVTSVNSQTGAVSLDTDDISEGTNKYFSNTLSRSAISVTDTGGDGALSYNSSTGVITYTGPSATDVRAHFSAGTGITITDGVVATTITQYADSNARSAISVTDSGGDGSLSYNSSTGVITYTGPSASEVRSHFSAGTGITITSGVIASTVTSGIADVVADTTPQLGGNLDVNGQQIVSASNGNIVIAPNGTGMTMLNNIEYHEKIHSLGTTSGTITPDVANGNVQTITLNGNLTFNAFANPISGQSLTLIITTNGTGRTLTSTMLYAGASKTLSTTSTVDILTVSYIGTTYYASLVKGYA